MKKTIILAITMAMFFSAAAYALNYKENNINEKKTIRFGKLVFNREIEIAYPQITEMKDNSLKNKINSIVKDTIISKYNNISRSFTSEINDRAQKKGDYSDTDPFAFNPYDYFYGLNYLLYPSDKNIISILFDEAIFMGPVAHPSNDQFSINIDTGSGKTIGFSELFNPYTDYLATISKICISELNKEFGTSDNEWINNGAGPKAVNFKVFNITEYALIITFPTYQVASYADGPRSVSIPLTSIKNFLVRSIRP